MKGPYVIQNSDNFLSRVVVAVDITFSEMSRLPSRASTVAHMTWVRGLIQEFANQQKIRVLTWSQYDSSPSMIDLVYHVWAGCEWALTGEEHDE